MKPCTDDQTLGHIGPQHKARVATQTPGVTLTTGRHTPRRIGAVSTVRKGQPWEKI